MRRFTRNVRRLSERSGFEPAALGGRTVKTGWLVSRVNSPNLGDVPVVVAL
jgi:hypothetical protein